MTWIENGVTCIGTPAEFRELHPAVTMEKKMEAVKPVTEPVKMPVVSTPARPAAPRGDKGLSRKWMVVTNESTLYIRGLVKLHQWYTGATMEKIPFNTFKRRLKNNFDFGHGICIERCKN